MEQSLASRIVNAVMGDLADRRGFKAVISDIDPDVVVELHASLAEKVNAVIFTHPAKPKTEEPKSDGRLAIDTLRAIAEGRLPHASIGDRIEAAKALLGRG